MSITLYDIGDVVGASATFTSTAGALEDPVTVTAEARKPDGSLLALTPTSSSPGVWTIAFEVDQPGRWHYRVAGTGGLTAAVDGAVDVRIPYV